MSKPNNTVRLHRVLRASPEHNGYLFRRGRVREAALLEQALFAIWGTYLDRCAGPVGGGDRRLLVAGVREAGGRRPHQAHRRPRQRREPGSLVGGSSA